MSKLLPYLNLNLFLVAICFLLHQSSIVGLSAQDGGHDLKQDLEGNPVVERSANQPMENSLEHESEKLPPLETDWRQWSDQQIGQQFVGWMQLQSLSQVECDAWLAKWQAAVSRQDAAFDRLDFLSQQFFTLDKSFGQRLGPSESVDLQFDLLRWLNSDTVVLPVPVIMPLPEDATSEVPGSTVSAELGVVHLRLAIGRKLVRHEFYDQALMMLADLSSQEVMFPRQLLFYRAVANFKLLNLSAAGQDLELINKHAQRLDRRMQTLTRLMLADLPATVGKPLEQVTRLMDDAFRRQSLSESGKLVLDQERKIVNLLDTMIKQKEEQQKQQQQQQQKQQSQAKPSASKPLQRSMRAPLLGKGEVDPKRMSARDWGDLPPEKQAEVIAEMTRKMPPHYRRVVEEYFRQLSEEK